MLVIKYTRIPLKAVKTPNRSLYRYNCQCALNQSTSPGEVPTQATNHRRPERMQDTRKRAALLLL